MTQEEKELLLKDLCARLPYGVKIKCGRETLTLNVNWLKWLINTYWNVFQYHLDEIKPYLRPMSSMTEEERNEYFGRTMTIDIVKTSQEVIDYCNAHHLDYRGLIPMGLALEAPEGMYKNN